MRRTLLLLLFGLVGCDSPKPAASPTAPTPAGPVAPAELSPIAPTPEGKAMAAANNRFALDFYAKLREKPGNLFVSPLSLHAALSMTAAGANGQTLAEMRQVLHLPAEPDAGYANLLAVTVGDRPGYQLRTANAVWGQKGYPWKKPFLDRLTAGFGAALKEADFKSQPEVERVRINDWAEEQTAGRVKDLLRRGDLNGPTYMVLVNAVYFKGEWAEQFDPGRTRPAPFTLADGNTTEVPLMNRTGGRVYAEFAAGEREPAFWVAALPYKGGEAELVLLVPGRPDRLPAVEAKLTPETLDGWLAALRPDAEAELAVPKLKLASEYREPDDGPQPLHALGMRSAFGPGAADFSGVDGSRELYVALVAHKAFVELSEEGTEAAAATAVVMKGRMGRAPLRLRADRPFLFLMRHNPTGAILFLGRYAGP